MYLALTRTSPCFYLHKIWMCYEYTQQSNDFPNRPLANSRYIFYMISSTREQCAILLLLSAETREAAQYRRWPLADDSPIDGRWHCRRDWRLTPSYRTRREVYTVGLLRASCLRRRRFKRGMGKLTTPARSNGIE